MRNFIGIFAVLAVIACTETTAPDLEYGNGRIDLASSRAPLVVLSDSATVGVPIDIRVTTLGFNSCWVNERTVTSITETDDLALIIPYNRSNEVASGGCYMVISDIDHTATLTFRTPGLKMIQVRGRDYSSGKPMDVNAFVMVYK